MPSHPVELSCLRSTKFPTWEPGHKVTIDVSAPEPMEWVVIMCIYGALFGSLIGYALSVGFNDFVQSTTMGFLEAFVVAALPISIVGAMHLAGGDQTEGTIEIDWECNQLIESRKFTKRRFPLSDLTKLVVRPEYELRGGSGPNANSEAGKERIHNACLFAAFTNTNVLLLSSESRDLIADSAVSEIMPVVRELANHLNVEVVTEEPRLRRHKNFLRALFSSPWWMWLLFFGLTALSTTWVCWRAGIIGG